MHGTAQFTAMIALTAGGAVASLPSRGTSTPSSSGTRSSALKVNAVSIVGMAFAQPMLDALDANPGRWDLRVAAPHRLVRHGLEHGEQAGAAGATCPAAPIFDSLGSSEAVGMGASASGAPAPRPRPPSSWSTPNSACFTEDGRRVEPGSGERGLLAVSGFLPVGYYKDPEKTDAHLQGLRGPALVGARRLGHGRGRRHR